jgi:hypothetical protein
MYPTRKNVDAITAVIMQAMWRRHAPCRIKYQPVEMKTVLMKLSDALIAGRSEIVMEM